MSQDEPIKAYIRSVRSSLHLPKKQRLRVLEEIENHLNDGAAAHMGLGTPRVQAITLAIDELGPPDEVAAGFIEHGARAPDHTGPMRWLPMLVPLFLLVPAAGFLAWNLTWYSGGLTTGEQLVQRTYALRALIAGALTCAAYLSIRRAHRDSAWRWAAWLCTGCAVAVALAT
jgi:hypothetical protein